VHRERGCGGIWQSSQIAVCEVNKEDGQKGLDEYLRNGEGTIGLQGCRMGWILEERI